MAPPFSPCQLQTSPHKTCPRSLNLHLDPLRLPLPAQTPLIRLHPLQRPRTHLAPHPNRLPRPLAHHPRLPTLHLLPRNNRLLEHDLLRPALARPQRDQRVRTRRQLAADLDGGERQRRVGPGRRDLDEAELEREWVERRVPGEERERGGRVGVCDDEGEGGRGGVASAGEGDLQVREGGLAAGGHGGCVWWRGRAGGVVDEGGEGEDGEGGSEDGAVVEETHGWLRLVVGLVELDGG